MNTLPCLYGTDEAPVLVLSPRYSSDSRILRQAALQLGWHTERLGGWDVPERHMDEKDAARSILHRWQHYFKRFCEKMAILTNVLAYPFT